VITRTVRIQLLVFVVIALLGVTYVGASYAGIGTSLFQTNSCTIDADFPDSGGIFTGAEVTYNGVTVGRVGKLSLLPDGVRVALDVDDCRHPEIPVDTVAAVSNRSAVGEQYVDLRPQTDSGPYLDDGAVLPMDKNVLPVPTQVLLQNLDSLVTSVDNSQLATVVTELGQAFNGRGPALQALLDQGSKLQQTATANLDTTIKLIEQSGPVLNTQLRVGSNFASWAKSLNLLTGTLKSSDSDLRGLLDDAPSDLQIIKTFVQSNSDDLGVLLANLVTVNGVVVPKLDSVKAILYIYPLAVAGGLTVVPGDGTAHFGLVLNLNDPPDCTAGYGGTDTRPPSDTSPATVNTSAQCTSPASSGINVRGAQNAPGGDPVYTGDSGRYVYPKVDAAAAKAQGITTIPGTTLPGVAVGGDNSGSSSPAAAGVLGDKSWLPLLTGPLS
jgi:phospholipid/cholesterol/gamma-HCH transport system substrate-binding protein